MTIEDIKQLISTDETCTLEFKKSTGEIKDGMRTICAFLNTQGGWLIFGIAPTSLKIIGQNVTDNTRQEIARELSKIEPFFETNVEYVPLPEKDNTFVIAIKVDTNIYSEAPYIYDGRPYYKVESTTKIMPQLIYEDRLRKRDSTKFSWEEQTNSDITIQDLDNEAIMDLVRNGIRGGRIPENMIYKPIEDILNKMKLLKNGLIKNACVVLFCKDNNGYPQLLLRMARFEGTDKRVFIDNRCAEGNIFKLLTEGLEFLFKHLNISGKTEGNLYREEKINVPYEALREALLNALAHREYRYSSGSVSIGIFDDRVEIRNAGSLPQGLTLQQLQEPHDSHSPNPQIAHSLYFGKLLETWGRGIQLMNDVCEQNGSPKPEFSESGTEFCVTFRFGLNTLSKVKSSINPGGIENANTERINTQQNIKGGINGGINGGIELSERQSIIIKMIENNPKITIAEISDMLVAKRRSIERDFKYLQDNQILSRQGGSRFGHWVISPQSSITHPAQ